MDPGAELAYEVGVDVLDFEVVDALGFSNVADSDDGEWTGFVAGDGVAGIQIAGFDPAFVFDAEGMAW